MSKISENTMSMLQKQSDEKSASQIPSDHSKQVWLRAWEDSAFELEADAYHSNSGRKRQYNGVAEQSAVEGVASSAGGIDSVNIGNATDMAKHLGQLRVEATTVVKVPVEPGAAYRSQETLPTLATENYATKASQQKRALGSNRVNAVNQHFEKVRYGKFNLHLSAEGDKATLWIRDKDSQSAESQDKIISEVRIFLKNKGFVLSRIMLNGQSLPNKLNEVKYGN